MLLKVGPAAARKGAPRAGFSDTVFRKSSDRLQLEITLLDFFETQKSVGSYSTRDLNAPADFLKLKKSLGSYATRD